MDVKKEYFELFDGVKTAFDPDAPDDCGFASAVSADQACGKKHAGKRRLFHRRLQLGRSQPAGRHPHESLRHDPQLSGRRV